MHNLVKDWLMSGRARFTVHNKSSDHYTYWIRKLNDGGRQGSCNRWLVSVLTHPGGYTYLGCLNPLTGRVSVTCGSRFTSKHLAVRVINWTLRVIWTGSPFPDGYGLCGEGLCGRCGRPLMHSDGAVDDGLASGCWKHTCEGRA